MFKVNNRSTTINCEICLMFIRTTLEHIRISQLVLGFQFGTLNMCFQTGLQFDVIRIYLLSKYIYIYIFLFSFFGFTEIVQLELYVGPFKYPGNIYLFKLNNQHARTSCGMCSALVIKTTEQRHSCRSTVFIVNLENIRHLALVFPFLTWKSLMFAG